MVKKGATRTDPGKLETSTAPILELSFTEPLFSAAVHPTKPIIAAGLGTGHLYCYSYDAETLETSKFTDKSRSNTLPSVVDKKWWTVVDDHLKAKTDGVSTIWKTKRHKGSCRSVIFDTTAGSEGKFLYSAGTDHVIKKAETETGKVVAKTSIAEHYLNNTDSVTTLTVSANSAFLLAGTDSGDVLVYDKNDLGSGKLKFKVERANEDSINKILPMPCVSDYHYLTLGSTTLAHIDIRKGIVSQSDDQSDELLSMCYPTDFITQNKNDTLLVTHGEGIVSIWRNSTNRFSDQLSRVNVNKNALVDCIVPTFDIGDDDMRDSVWCGDSEGWIHRINYKKGKVVETRQHSDFDDVAGLDIDPEYRLVSYGMDTLKIWSGQKQADVLADDDSSSSSDFSGSSEDENGSEEDEDDGNIESSDEGRDDDAADLNSSLDSEDAEDADPTPIVRKKRSFVTGAKKTINLKVEKTEPAPKKIKPTKKRIDSHIARFEGL